jgi:hypothetical protein
MHQAPSRDERLYPIAARAGALLANYSASVQTVRVSLTMRETIPIGTSAQIMYTSLCSEWRCRRTGFWRSSFARKLARGVPCLARVCDESRQEIFAMSETRSKELAQLARRALDARNFTEARTFIDRALLAAPPLRLAADLLVMRSMTQRAIDDTQGARESLQEALQWYSALGVRPPDTLESASTRRTDTSS